MNKGSMMVYVGMPFKECSEKLCGLNNLELLTIVLLLFAVAITIYYYKKRKEVRYGKA